MPLHVLNHRVRAIARAATKNLRRNRGERQDIDIYSDPQFADLLENWGNDTVWKEIQVLLANRSGRALDLACGTGRTWDFLKHNRLIEIHGCDISPLLIGRAEARGIPKERLRVLDATQMTYSAKEFDYVYSIGSLEHFTEDGLLRTLRECRRVCKGLNFHQIPVSRSDLDEGWISPLQSYWNNSEGWWRRHFESVFGSRVYTMSSAWQDAISRGVWFIAADESLFQL